MPSTLQAPRLEEGARRGTYDSYDITAAQTFKVGDWVYEDANGGIAIAATASNDVGNIKLLGVAKGDAAQCLTLGVGCPVEPTDDSQWYLLPVYHSTPGSANIALNELDTPLTLPLRNQGGVWCINKENNGTNDRMIVLKKFAGQPWGEQYGWFWCKSMPAGRLDHAS